MIQSEKYKNYQPIIWTSFSMVLFMRIIELTGISILYVWKNEWMLFETIGLLYDYCIISLALVVYYFVFQFIIIRNKRLAIYLTNGLFAFLSMAHLLILLYFFHERTPLDVFLYQYSYEEIYFTVTTAEIPFLKVLILLAVIGSLPVFLFWALRRLQKQVKSKIMTIFILSGSILSFFLLLLPENNNTKFIVNKSSFFYTRSLVYFSTPTTHYDELNSKNIGFFQAQYPHKEFISKKYPLVHLRSENNNLFENMNEFDSIPNIVYIIVEGLSDAYVNEYHGMKLMPFLNGLKKESMYWSNCLTLGERSFAVVGSSLGGLPYGDLGFTLLKRYPRHHSLVNMLGAKGFQTSFYTGQASWFHKNGDFFHYNNVDKVYDQTDFGEEFSQRKIIVGNDRFFWGYNDKDLFKLSLNQLNKSSKQPYFMTFFTGSTHPPFIISDEAYYTQKLQTFKNKNNSEFISTNKKYLRTILFADDAIRDFIDSYKKRDDYKNTVFIITGDHPMSEIPRDGELRKYHVPLIIYSPKLKQPKVYPQLVSHLDLSTTILKFLENYITPFPKETASLGYSLFPSNKKTTHKYAFMDGNRAMYEYYSDGYFLRKNQLFKVNKDLSLTEIRNDKLKERLNKELKNFKTINYNTSLENKIISNKLYVEGLQQKVIFTNKSSKKTNSSEEFITLVPSISIPNQAFQIDYDAELVRGMNKESTIVVEVKSQKDSVLFWKNSSLPKLGPFKVNYKILKFPIADTSLKFSVYIWNPKKEEIILKNRDALLLGK
jgi:phosphoglycerol transferase MdoB-like AlkP superfamily enzyme